MNKKFLATSIALATIAAQGTTFASILPEEIVGTKYEEPIQVLAALEIMVGDDNGKLRLDDTIKRSESFMPWVWTTLQNHLKGFQNSLMLMHLTGQMAISMLPTLMVL